ncbi:hypothetical protein CHRYSEO8AT_480011 [Chryseobacterium sp. 8AT]|nr:hypothetical protein CHRYSEO8AT_480011 [Chryseobacterium sp. 8AT]
MDILFCHIEQSRNVNKKIGMNVATQVVAFSDGKGHAQNLID